jgi:hypothetical protein
MAATTASKRRVAERQDRLRAQGMRPIQIWVPDVRAPGFAAEAHRQARAVAASETSIPETDQPVEAVIWRT